MNPLTATQAVGSDDYTELCETVRRNCGIDLMQYKRGQMERRIRSFARSRGHEDLSVYAKELNGEELDAFLDRVTINVSQLWRNPEQWDALERLIIPDLATEGRVRCWSAGSSYGAEAYTLASTCLRAAPKATVSILGTDIDKRVVARAREGIFSVEDARDAPPHVLASHFTRRDDGTWAAKDELKRLVRFEQGDLLRVSPRAGSYDLVLCRNTVIYFNEDVRDALHGRLAASLRSGGRLVVGATERVADPAAHGLIPESPFVYLKS